ncbi:uncharacterized protein BXZ73DRAFT_85992 [Epithele typhae]|uniref:uncharacterized protein n=1 Tax=Epithele typhae TaxID=378194 RepID=UPI002007CF73|nr:uncharacterized protein BXZ73DRAFT_85992 [Epithele typhae]KAH9892220.1 hypothetical protein BXZ73DRAFT_85992 [Epithele typhae]
MTVLSNVLLALAMHPEAFARGQAETDRVVARTRDTVYLLWELLHDRMQTFKDGVAGWVDAHRSYGGNDNGSGWKTKKIDKDIHFEDGNVILAVEDVEFKLYRGILIKHSSVFADLLAAAPPSLSSTGAPSPSTGKAEPRVTESARTVVVLKDSVRDWRHVLRALFQGTMLSEYFSPLICTELRCLTYLSVIAGGNSTTWSPSFDQLSAYARLGHKYKISAVYDPSMVYLRRYFKPTLAKWKQRSTGPGLEPYTMPLGRPEHSIGVVNLARQMGCLSLLPLALLCCCQLGPRMDGGFVYSNGEKEMLSGEDTLLYLKSVPAIASYGVANSLSFAAIPTTSKCKKDGCVSAVVKAMRDRKVLQPSPFIQTDNVALCMGCRQCVDRMNEQALKDLPSLFEHPGTCYADTKAGRGTMTVLPNPTECLC